MADELEQQIVAARGGDRAALQLLLLRHYDMVELRLRGWMRDAPGMGLTVDDLVQETFAEAVKAIRMFESTSPAAFSKWLRRLARRRFAYHLRLAVALKRGGVGGGAAGDKGGEWEGVLTEVYREAPSPRSVVARAEQVEMLRAILEGVESRYREAIRLRYIEQQSFKEIALKMGGTPEAAQMVCRRALRKLRTLMPESTR